MHRLFILPIVCVVWFTQLQEVAAAPKRKTTCEHTGNAYFYKVCAKKPQRCRMEYGIQYFMFNGEPSPRRFTFRCVLRYGRGLRKQRVASDSFILKPTVNCLGGVSFTWPKRRVDKATRQYKYKCTCTVSTLRLATRKRRSSR